MAIAFEEIVNLNIPFVYAELVRKPVLTGTVKQPYQALIFGQKTAAGTANAEEILDIFSANEAKTKFGINSMLANAIDKYFDINKGVPLKVIALDDEGTGTQASGSVALTGTATANGTLSVYINGNSYRVAVASGDTNEDVASLLADKINESETEQVTAVAATGTVTLTAVHKGTFGNELKIISNLNSDDATPQGISVAITDMSGGAGNPDLTNVITILENNQFNLIAQPYTDNATLLLIDTALTDNFRATEMLDSFCVVGVNDTVSNLTTKTDSLNTPFITILDNYESFSTGFEQAAGAIATIGDIAQSNPGASYLNETLNGFISTGVTRLRTERNSLAGGGVGTIRTVGSRIVFDRTVTTFQKDENLQPISIDNRDLRVFLTISFVRYAFILRMSQFQGYKLGNDNDIFGAGTLVMTPNLYKENLTIVYQQLVTDAVCEDLQGFIDTLIVEKDGNRLNSSMEVDIINVLLQQAMRINYIV
jgi:phage tail sheath gpL-like